MLILSPTTAGSAHIQDMYRCSGARVMPLACWNQSKGNLETISKWRKLRNRVNHMKHILHISKNDKELVFRIINWLSGEKGQIGYESEGDAITSPCDQISIYSTGFYRQFSHYSYPFSDDTIKMIEKRFNVKVEVERIPSSEMIGD